MVFKKGDSSIGPRSSIGASVREIMRDQPAASNNPVNRKRKQKEINLEPEAYVLYDDDTDFGSEDDFSQDEDYVTTSEDVIFDDDEVFPVQRRRIPNVQETRSGVGRKKSAVLPPRAPKAASKPRPRAPPMASAAPLLSSSRKRAEVPVHPHQLISEKEGIYPQGFQPQGLQPHDFQPQGFQQQGFQPQGFPPQGFQPQAQAFQQHGFQSPSFHFQDFRPQVFQPQVFQPQGQGVQSQGQMVKEKGIVVVTQKTYSSGKSANIMCKVDAMGGLLEKVKEDKNRRAIIERCGFGDLFHVIKLKNGKFCKGFAYWLMSRVDGHTGLFEMGDGRQVPLCPTQWHCIFNLPAGSKDLPRKVSDGGLAFEEKYAYVLKKLYGVKDKNGRCGMSVDLTIEKILTMPVITRKDQDDFMIGFLVAMMGGLICPTIGGKHLAASLGPPVCVGVEARDYDWCTLAHEWLMTCARDFAARFEPSGYAAGAGGCSLFLMIFYLDRLCMTPMRWGVYPRIEVWTVEKIREGYEKDVKKSKDYGLMKSLDVAYGERHPWVPRDSVEPFEVTVANEVLKAMTPWLHRLEQLYSCGNRVVIRSPLEKKAEHKVLSVSSDENQLDKHNEQIVGMGTLNGQIGHLDHQNDDSHQAQPNANANAKDDDGSLRVVKGADNSEARCKGDEMGRGQPIEAEGSGQTRQTEPLMSLADMASQLEH